MKKFRILALVLALIMTLTALAGCGDKKESVDVDSDITQNEEVDNNSSVVLVEGEIVNADGKVFGASIETKGNIKDGVSVNSDEVTICGKTYSFPVKISDLLSDGWYLPKNVEFDNEFEAKKITNLVSFYLYYEDGSEIALSQLYNDTDKVQKIEDCILTGFDIYTYKDVNFVFPGGITDKSTAADVLTVYGDPNKTTAFESGYNLEKQLTYVGHKDTGFRLSYTFNEDGSLYFASIELED